MHVCFCWVCFSFSVLSREIGWEERLQYHTFCVVWDVKPQLSQFLLVPDSVNESVMFLGCPIISFFWSDFVTMMFLEWLELFDKTIREYLLAPADDWIRFWRSKVKVAARPSMSNLVNTISYELLKQSG